jgi:hypothetical protein
MKIIKSIFGLAFFMLAVQINAQDPPEPPAPIGGVYFEKPELLNGFLKMTADDEKEYLKNASPEIKEYFKQIKSNDERRYYSLLREYYFSSLRYPLMRRTEAQMQNTQKEIIEQEIKTEALAAKYQKASSNDKAKVRDDLEQSLTYLFDLKENQREIEVKELESQLRELKDKMNIRKKNKSTIIKRRIEELLGDDKYLEWE